MGTCAGLEPRSMTFSERAQTRIAFCGMRATCRRFETARSAAFGWPSVLSEGSPHLRVSARFWATLRVVRKRREVARAP